LGNYAFAYDESHAEGGTFRKESGSADGPVIGSYGLRDVDGRVRVVNYVADGSGFRAAIATNEPGIVPKAPASVSISKPDVAVVAAAPVLDPVHAPVAAIADPAVVASRDIHQAETAPLAAPIQHVQLNGHDLGINSPLVASLAAKIITARPLAYTGAVVAGPIAHHPTHPADQAAHQLPIGQLTDSLPIDPTAHAYQPIAASQLASDALVRSYATSIYGPSLLSGPNTIAATILASNAAVARPTVIKSLYQPPLDAPSVQYLPADPIESSLQPQPNDGHYEPSLAYAHPNSWGYTLGLPSTWGYQMVYRRKK
jgi:hypothetical protein